MSGSAAGAASAQRIILDFGPGYDGPPPPGYGRGYGPPPAGYGPGYGPPPPGYGPGYGPPGPYYRSYGGGGGPAVSELGTVASRAGLCRTVSANRTGAISSVPRPRDGRASSAGVHLIAAYNPEQCSGLASANSACAIACRSMVYNARVSNTAAIIPTRLRLCLSNYRLLGAKIDCWAAIEPLCHPARLINWSSWGAADVFARESIWAEHLTL